MSARGPPTDMLEITGEHYTQQHSQEAHLVWALTIL
jgi:hypothetical protein